MAFFPRLAIAVLQRNIRKYLFLRDWKWWKLYTKASLPIQSHSFS